MDDRQYTSPEEAPASVKSIVWEIIKFFVIAALIVIPIRMYVAQPFLVEGPSMEPTFHTGDYLIVDELSYRFGTPQRGDVAVVDDPNRSGLFLIKRIIGLPHETVVIENGTITIIPENDPRGFTLQEPYVEHTRGTSITEELGANEYFIMGDNRAQSLDSRVFGPVHRNELEGRVFLRLFPFQDVAILPGSYHTYQ